MTERVECWQCGRALDDVPAPFARDATCPACESDLHVCRMCEFYAPAVAKSCREPIAEEVLDKTRANFCDYLRVRPGAHRVDEAASKARDELASLFGLSSESTQQSTAPDPKALEDAKRRKADEAGDELRRLFGLDKD